MNRTKMSQSPPPSYEEATRPSPITPTGGDPESRSEASIRIFFCHYPNNRMTTYEDCPTATSKDATLIIKPTTTLVDLQQQARARYAELFPTPSSFCWTINLCAKYTEGDARHVDWSHLTDISWCHERAAIIAEQENGDSSRTRFLKMDVRLQKVKRDRMEARPRNVRARNVASVAMFFS